MARKLMLIERVCTKMAKDEVRPNFPFDLQRNSQNASQLCDKVKSDINYCCPSVHCRHAVSDPAGGVCNFIEAKIIKMYTVEIVSQ